MTWTQSAGVYDVAVQYFDTWRGVSHFQLHVDGNSVAEWDASNTLPPAQFDPKMDGQTSTRFTAQHVPLKPGSVLTLVGIPDLESALSSTGTERASPGSIHPDSREHRDYREYAAVDYIEVGPDGALTPQQ
jgi:alpha-glucuronidase